MSNLITNQSNVAPMAGAGAMETKYKSGMYRSVVFIETNSAHGEGSGSIVDYYKSPPMLLTCHHVIPSVDVAAGCTVYFDWEDAGSPGTAVPGKDLFDLSTFQTNIDKDQAGLGLDCTLLTLNTAAIPEFDKRELLHLDDYLTLKEFALRKQDQVYLIHYPLMEGKFVRRESPYLVQFTNGFLIGHEAETHGGSSGCPVLKEVNHKWVLVGLHRGTINKLVGKSLAINLATDIAAVHGFCTVRGYKPPDVDIDKLLAESTKAKETIDPQKMQGAVGQNKGGRHKWNPEAESLKNGKDNPPQSEAVLESYVDKRPGYAKDLRRFVADQVADNWKKLAQNLHIPKNVIYQQTHGESVSDGMQNLLQFWADENCEQDDSKAIWSVLIKAMEDSSMKKEAKALKAHLLGASA